MVCLSLACCHFIIILCSALVWTLRSLGIYQELVIPVGQYSRAVYLLKVTRILTRGRTTDAILLSKVNDEERRAEQRKYGVFFDDDYDYLQHLREPSGPAELIPSSTPSTYSSRGEEDTSVFPVSFKCKTVQHRGDTSFPSQYLWGGKWCWCEERYRRVYICTIGYGPLLQELLARLTAFCQVQSLASWQAAFSIEEKQRTFCILMLFCDHKQSRVWSF